MSLFQIILVYLLLFVFPFNCTSDVFGDEARKDCRVCGMWIDQYMHTRHVLTTTDGTQIYFCSYTCTAKYLKMNQIKVKLLQVADYLTTDLVNVENAFYLVESDAPPVMSYTSIIAFANKKSADSFQELHGGKIMTFAGVLAKY
ncbi:MAG: nitrous oxide reductase accessory protein NosL [Desulfobulbales bacterium]